MQCHEKALELNEHMLALIQYAEGIKTSSDGFITSHGEPVGTGDYFAKAILHQELSMETAAINDARVYETMKKTPNRYTNIIEIISDIDLTIETLLDIGDEESNLWGANSCAEVYVRDYEALYELVSNVEIKTRDAIDEIQQYNLNHSQLENSIEQCKKSVTKNKDVLGEEAGTTIGDDLDELSNENYGQINLCNIDTVDSSLQKNSELLNSARDVLDNIPKNLYSKNALEIKEHMKQCKNILLGLSNTGIIFDYSNIKFEGEGDGGSQDIKNLISNLKDGITGIVLNGKNISRKEIHYDQLASSLCSERGEVDNTLEIAETVLYNEYLFMKFNSYIDYLMEDKTIHSDTGKELDYVMEYILEGKDCDYDNISGVISELSLIREGINFLYLLTDATKRNQAYSLALSMSGLTGNMVIIKTVQYLILAAWAYGESVVDLQQLYDGKKIPTVKTSSTWNMSLEQLMGMNFNVEETKGEKGLDYEAYLKVLLFSKNATHKYYRTMSAIELHMIEMGHDSFRIKNYICRIHAQAVFNINGIQDYYVRDLEYGYT
jgi:hypothetical protein